MPINYKTIVPWGRSFTEYTKMFKLTKDELNLKILGCADGPASFNAEMHKLGKKVISVDPIYQFSAEQIQKRIAETYEEVLRQTRENQDKFIWQNFKSVEELGTIRLKSMQTFLADFELGKAEARYLFAELPTLQFQDKTFDLALSSHFLFLYSDHLSLEFHLAAVQEMLRVAKEVRIFPLFDLNAQKSLYVEEIKKIFRQQNFLVEEVEVDYEFQKGANRMLTLK